MRGRARASPSDGADTRDNAHTTRAERTAPGSWRRAMSASPGGHSRHRARTVGQTCPQRVLDRVQYLLGELERFDYLRAATHMAAVSDVVTDRRDQLVLELVSQI